MAGEMSLEVTLEASAEGKIGEPQVSEPWGELRVIDSAEVERAKKAYVREAIASSGSVTPIGERGAGLPRTIQKRKTTRFRVRRE